MTQRVTECSIIMIIKSSCLELIQLSEEAVFSTKALTIWALVETKRALRLETLAEELLVVSLD